MPRKLKGERITERYEIDDRVLINYKILTGTFPWQPPG
jgi:hypothetical protein